MPDTITTESPYTHLISDCDGVLIDSEAVALQALLDLLAPRLADLPEGVTLQGLIEPRLGLRLVPLMRDIYAELGLPPLPEEELLAIAHGVNLRCDEQLSAVPGVAQALAAIGLPKAVASNSVSARVHAALTRTGMVDLFGGRYFTPDLVGHAKPHPGLYLAAAAGFGVPPGQCLVLEDSVTGVTAAVAAGMTVLGFIGGGHIAEGQEARLKAAGAAHVFSDMSKLPALVAQIRG
ncbi:HAD-IA family hydrolase [Janthinobacterium psychrotolerans]|uniref:Haloacid dehalogenase superfamily, subfamily IA, variant 3 with third motif having DD or ED n=1 Tax=Janthinobacterium psychrotolerans TaxID=1747903 RepID=A0A1A7BYF3_9BURK|nr:HAD-IA family hydrolase [Janthinobacterium psychrotolerans]OBV37505.1 haloacid dehalogenase superfamily, subfamily IA, variant 3 with third motif having DD or ED [Janthinobacterium psychrotolerans]